MLILRKLGLQPGFQPGGSSPEGGSELAFFVYLLYSESLDRYYIGQTSDLTRRVIAHNAGYVKSTKSGCPWTVVGYETYKSRSEARWREQQLKLHSDRKFAFIKQLRAAKCL